MPNLPPDERSRKFQLRTYYVACAALAIAVGHVVYAVFRDHVFD